VSSSEIPVYDSSALRIALFKSTYLEERFDLNKKADANEALQCIISSLHSSFLKPDSDHCDAKSCLIHEAFGLNLKIERICKCGKQAPAEDYT
jgi:hypothetical protein